MTFLAATKVDGYSFTVAGDIEDLAHCGRRVIMDASGTYVVSNVWYSVYSSPNTTVHIEENVCPVGLNQAAFGVGARELQQLPNHQHSNVEGDGGFIESRMEMEYDDSDEITILPGAYMLYSSDGKRDRVMYNDAELTFQFGSGGSNASSDDLTASDIHYLSLDESVCKAQRSRKLTAGCFINHTAEPTFSDTKKQWLNGNDRNIWAIPTNSSSEIFPFVQIGKNIYYFEHETTTDLVNADIDTSWLSYTANIPVFSQLAYFWFMWGGSVASAAYLFTKPTSFGTTEYSILTYIDGDTEHISGNAHIVTDSNQSFDLKASASSTLMAYFQSSGFTLGGGL